MAELLVLLVGWTDFSDLGNAHESGTNCDAGEFLLDLEIPVNSGLVLLALGGWCETSCHTCLKPPRTGMLGLIRQLLLASVFRIILVTNQLAFWCPDCTIGVSRLPSLAR